MAKPAASVEISHTIDIKSIVGMLPELGAKVLEGEKNSMVDAVVASWSGWQYVRYTRKDGTRVLWPKEFIGESGRSWKGSVQATENPFGITIFNDARSIYPSGKSKPYSGFVRRSKGARLESEIVLDTLVEEHVPQLRKRVIDFLLTEVFAPGPRKKVRVTKATGKITLDAIEF